MSIETRQKFLAKREQWLDWLVNDDLHAIRSHVHDLLWDYAVFISLNKLRQISQIKPCKTVGFNGTVLRLLDSGFVATQVMRIRRLTEQQNDEKTKEVISLRCLIKDLKDNRDLITRENYVTVKDRPYDYEVVCSEELKNIEWRSGVHVNTMKSSGPWAWEIAELSHFKFDEISGVPANMRSKSDLIALEYFRKLEDSLSICDDLREYSNKYIAHAASPSSRSVLTERQKQVTLGQLKKCHKRIYQVTNSILSDIFFDESMGGLPNPAFALFENLEKGWATKANLKDLQKVWKNYEQKVAKW